MIKRVKVPLIVIKNLFYRDNNESKGFNFLVAIDGSNKSFQGFSVAKSLLKSFKDKITAVYVTNKNSDNREIQNKFELSKKELKH